MLNDLAVTFFIVGFGMIAIAIQLEISHWLEQHTEEKINKGD